MGGVIVEQHKEINQSLAHFEFLPLFALAARVKSGQNPAVGILIRTASFVQDLFG